MAQRLIGFFVKNPCEGVSLTENQTEPDFALHETECDKESVESWSVRPKGKSATHPFGEVFPMNFQHIFRR